MRNLIAKGRTSEVYKEGEKAFKIYSSSLLTQTQKEQVLEVFDSLSFEPSLAHMDFHPHNLKYYQGNYWILDWVNAGLANPLLCIAQTYILLHYHAPRRCQKHFSLVVNRMRAGKQRIREAAIIQAADRIMETDDPHERGFIHAYRARV